MKRETFVFYTEWADQFELLNVQQRSDLIMSILYYQQGRELPDMDGITKMAFSFIKKALDRDSEKWLEIVEKRREAGKLGGRPKKQEKAKKPNGFPKNQTKAKKPDNDNDYDNDNDNDHDNKRRFVKPTVEQVREYCSQRNNGINPQSFIDYYETRGWKLSKGVSMKDWRAAVRTWESRHGSYDRRQAAAMKPPERDYDMDKLTLKLLATN